MRKRKIYIFDEKGKGKEGKVFDGKIGIPMPLNERQVYICM